MIGIFLAVVNFVLFLLVEAIKCSFFVNRQTHFRCVDIFWSLIFDAFNSSCMYVCAYSGSFSYFCILCHSLSLTLSLSLALFLNSLNTFVLPPSPPPFFHIISPFFRVPCCECVSACVNFNIDSGFFRLFFFVYQHQTSHLRYNVVKFESKKLRVQK